MNKHIQVFTTAGGQEDARAIADRLVERRLAACVQILGPITSTYRWQGKVERAQEWLCLIKTRGELYAQVEAAIREVHTYDEPEILAIPVVAGSRGYLAWLDAEVAGGRTEGGSARGQASDESMY